MTDRIRVEGLAKFSRALKKLDSDLPKALRVALNDVAGTVADDARQHVPRRTGRAAASIKPASTRTMVRVSEGGPRAPYMPWLDYGGRVGRNRSVHRPFQKQGRYLSPAYRRAKDSGTIERALSNALVGVARSAGVEVT